MSEEVSVIVDVREPEEFKAGHVKGAINLPLSQLSDESEELRDIPKDAKVVPYCNTGRRSGLAMDVLKRVGYKNAVNGVSQEEVQNKYF